MLVNAGMACIVNKAACYDVLIVLRFNASVQIKFKLLLIPMESMFVSIGVM